TSTPRDGSACPARRCSASSGVSRRRSRRPWGGRPAESGTGNATEAGDRAGVGRGAVAAGDPAATGPAAVRARPADAVIWERVAQVLLSKGRISRSQLVEARRTQGFFGGRLVGHLLRLGYVDEASLGEALTEVFGVPFADASRFQRLPDEVRA